MKTIQHQRGSTLIMILVILSVLLMSSMALYRSTEMNTLISGNIVNNATAKLLSDYGVMLSVNKLNGMTNLDAASSSYFPTQQHLDKNGLPMGIDWSKIPSRKVQQHHLQFVVERLCTGALPVTNPGNQCTIQSTSAGNSKKSSSASVTKNKFYFRTTVRINGPKHGLAYYQAIVQVN